MFNSSDSLSCALTLFGFFFLLSVATKKLFGSWTLSWSGSVPVPYNWTLLQRRSSPKQNMEIIDYRIRVTSPTSSPCHLSPLYVFLILKIRFLIQSEESTLIAPNCSLRQVQQLLWVQEAGETQKENFPRKVWLVCHSKSAACWAKYERLLSVSELSCVP